MFNRKRQEFYETLVALLRLGNAPLSEIVKSLGQSEQNVFFGNALKDISTAMASGVDFPTALKHHPITFPHLEVELLGAVKKGAPFERMLLSLARLNEVRHPLWRSLVAVAVGLLITTGTVSFLMFLVVPMFEEMFIEMLAGEPLPALTRLYIAASHLFTDNLPGLMLALGFTFWAYLCLRFSSPSRFRNPLYNLLPFSHTIGLERDCQQFCQRLAALTQNGVHINSALEKVAGKSETHILFRHAHSWLQKVEKGIPLEAAVNVEPARKGPVQLLQDTLSIPFDGTVSDELEKLAFVYEERSKRRGALLPISAFALIVLINFFLLGTCILSMFMPLLRMTTCLC